MWHLRKKGKEALQEAQERLDGTTLLEKKLDEKLSRVDRLRQQNHIYEAILDTFRSE